MDAIFTAGPIDFDHPVYRALCGISTEMWSANLYIGVEEIVYDWLTKPGKYDSLRERLIPVSFAEVDRHVEVLRSLLNSGNWVEVNDMKMEIVTL